MDVPIKRFDKNFPLPEAESDAACFDLICRETVTIPPHTIRPVAQNIAVKVPNGYALLLFIRSSTPLKKGILLANGVGVVDPFYCGDKDEILAFFLNVTDTAVVVEANEQLVQCMMVKTEIVNWKEVDTMSDPGTGGYKKIST